MNRFECIARPRGDGPRRLALLDDIRLDEGTRDDWEALAPLHYRGHRLDGADRIWALRYHGEPGPWPPLAVAVLVTAHPPVNLAPRNRALAELVGRLPRRGRARFWNAHLRTISRVVVDPNWRGLGLAVRLVREVLPRVGVPYVEAQATMGRVHPFFERAGMTRYRSAPPAASERMQEALAAAGVSRRALRSAEALERAVADVADAGLRRWLDGEMLRWARRYAGSRSSRRRSPTLSPVFRQLATHLASHPAYFLWADPKRAAAPTGCRCRS